MTPDKLAARHPKLYHLTFAGNIDSILTNGLHPTGTLVSGSGMQPHECDALLSRRRATSVAVAHGAFGTVTINDNAPLNEIKLARCLDDGLQAPDWLRMLNERVFFFTEERFFSRLAYAKATRGVAKKIIVADTLGLVAAHLDRIEIAPINTGATIHNPARRGFSTFAPLKEVDFPVWRRQREKKALDVIKEVIVRGSIPDLERHILEIRDVDAAA